MLDAGAVVAAAVELDDFSWRTFGDKDVYAGLGATVVAGKEVRAEAEAGQPVKYAMDTDDYRSYRAALAGGPYRPLLGPRSRLAN